LAFSKIKKVIAYTRRIARSPYLITTYNISLKTLLLDVLFHTCSIEEFGRAWGNVFLNKPIGVLRDCLLFCLSGVMIPFTIKDEKHKLLAIVDQAVAKSIFVLREPSLKHLSLMT
jgi:hypothetical protein